MTRLLRGLRAALGIAVTWSALWAAVGFGFGILFLVLRPQDVDPGEGPGRAAFIFGLVGFLGGLGFAALLAGLERRRTLHQLSLPRMALWGAVAAGGLPLLLGADPSVGVITGSLGALFGTATLAVARRGALAAPEEPLRLE